MMQAPSYRIAPIGDIRDRCTSDSIAPRLVILPISTRPAIKFQREWALFLAADPRPSIARSSNQQSVYGNAQRVAALHSEFLLTITPSRGSTWRIALFCAAPNIRIPEPGALITATYREDSAVKLLDQVRYGAPHAQPGSAKSSAATSDGSGKRQRHIHR